VVRLQAENVKRLRAVDISVGEDEPVVVLTGKNAAGKSSVLDAIWYALGGKGAAPSKPIREGKQSASVILNLGKFVVERRFLSDDRSRLEVRAPDGATYQSPQTLLDSLLGELTFDPLEFARQDRKRQRETLLRVMGVVVDDLDARRKELFDERIVVGREVRAAKILLDEQEQPKGEVPDVEVDVSGVHARITDAKLAVRGQEQTIERKDSLMRRRQEIAEEIENLDRRRNELVARMEDQEVAARTLDAQIVAHVPPDLAGLEAELVAAAETNDLVQRRRGFRKQLDRLHRTEATWDELTKQIALVETEKEARLARAGLPLSGLGLDDEGVTYNGLPFEQLSSAEQLRVSMATAMAANPELRVIRISDGSLLDSTSMEIVRQMAIDGDWQIWVERVDETGRVGVYIEDGEIAADNRGVEKRSQEGAEGLAPGA